MKEDDQYLPLVPGVYSSAQCDLQSRIGRVCSYSYVSGTGQYTNPLVEQEPEEERTLSLATFPRTVLHTAAQRFRAEIA